MDKHSLEIFQNEVKKECQFALLAVEDMEKSLASMKAMELPLQVTMSRFWYSVQSFLVSVGNISKLLWNKDEKIKNRGKDLRESLSVNDNSTLQPKNFRNKFEHFDEYIEEWAMKSKNRNFVDGNIGFTFIGGMDASDQLRNFDDKNWVLAFQGELYRLKPIIEELRNLSKYFDEPRVYKEKMSR